MKYQLFFETLGNILAYNQSKKNIKPDYFMKNHPFGGLTSRN